MADDDEEQPVTLGAPQDSQDVEGRSPGDATTVAEPANDRDGQGVTAAGGGRASGGDATPTSAGRSLRSSGSTRLRTFLDAAQARRRAFPNHELTPCVGIEPGTGTENEALAERFAVLERPLPLVGGLALRPARGRGIYPVEELRERLPWFDAAITLIERQAELALWAGRPWLQWRPLCLAGPPGIGKNFLASAITEIADVPVRTLSLGGADDVRILDGTSRGYINVQPSFPALSMAQTRVANPVVVLDEVDKVSPWRGHAIHDVLLMMLEPSTARRYYDKALLADVDLSAVLWILTVNDVTRLPAALRSRLDVVWSDGPAVADFDLVLETLLAAVARDWGVPVASLPAVPAPASQIMRDTFRRSRSIRTIRRMLELALAAAMHVPSPDLH